MVKINGRPLKMTPTLSCRTEKSINIEYAHSVSFSCAAHVVGGEPDDIQVPARLPVDGLRPRAHTALRSRGPSHA